MAPRSPLAGTLTMSEALGAHAPLAGLLQRARESRSRYDAIVPLLAGGLRTAVRPGPLDEEGWTLLASHGAAAAKLRQLLPRLDTVLKNAGWAPVPIRVRVLPPESPTPR
ncbi:hypothetical protein CKO44_17170 [Rubrivivax gelatinosus]|uniref:DUF721 domain-containing protein n=1 Tax=Rubrivivax gelatinosus TaxID=28068 RepID=A0ABS1DRF1_RUBGE|nr:hypothetical protein [Rubrivivax gelatinosus]MBK1615194.1 hypothetical protein [Rubrivivax gelatinosus]MBK1712513.1 hypothetical protein [Rubrivivax gelatinosus]